MAENFELDDRIEIHNIDAGSKEGLKLVGEADLVIMHNPFEWFAKDGGRSIFKELTKTFKGRGFRDIRKTLVMIKRFRLKRKMLCW